MHQTLKEAFVSIDDINIALPSPQLCFLWMTSGNSSPAVHHLQASQPKGGRHQVLPSRGLHGPTQPKVCSCHSVPRPWSHWGALPVPFQWAPHLFFPIAATHWNISANSLSAHRGPSQCPELVPQILSEDKPTHNSYECLSVYLTSSFRVMNEEAANPWRLGLKKHR